MIPYLSILSKYKKEGLKAILKYLLGRSTYLRFKGDTIERVYIPQYRHPIYLRRYTSDYSTFKQIYVKKDYDISIDFEPKIIIDAGANVGLASVYFANRFPNAIIYAIEPEQSNFEALVQNCKP